jgi:hypothetical protein
VKKIVLLVVLAAFCQGMFLFAQERPSFRHESEFYYFNFSIEKVYAYRLGYMVIYRNSSNRVARTFIPQEWFTAMGGRGELVFLSSGTEWPSMSVYYRNGEFSHVRLRLRRERAHQTWGVVPLNINIDEYFRNIEEVRLEF